MSELKGKVVVLNFWFVKCGPCVMEMPELSALKQQYNSKDVVFLAITFDKTEMVEQLLAKKEFTYTIVPNANDVIQMYGVQSFPTSVVIDQNSKVAFKDAGYRLDIKEVLSREIAKVL